MQDSGSPLTFINLDYFFGKFYDFLKWIYDVIFGGSLGHFLQVLFAIFCVLFIFVIFYTIIRIVEMKVEDKRKRHEEERAGMMPTDRPKNERWETVQGHISSLNPVEWRLAIIEADSMLDELVIKLNFRGETLGERLKNVEPADFRTINAAWEAHKVRNKIAHEGSAYELTKSDAERTIQMYEDVFKEFSYI